MLYCSEVLALDDFDVKLLEVPFVEHMRFMSGGCACSSEDDASCRELSDFEVRLREVRC